jgi:SulP family sulfate permease
MAEEQTAKPRRKVGLPLHPFHPRLIDCLRNYDRATFTADLIAGITVGVVALPLAMAFAIASGLKPEAGIFTAIVAGMIISLLGGSRVQIGGPAGAFIVIVYGIIQQHGLANLMISTVMAGILLFVMGLTRIGSLIRFIPVAIIIGFTNGIAVLIALSQLKDFFGLQIEKMPADFFHASRAIFDALDTTNALTLSVGLASLAVIIAWPRFGKLVSTRRDAATTGRTNLVTRLPGTIIALVLATAATAFLNLPVETIGSRFGGIPTGLPSFVLPELSWDAMRNLVAPTITIALLGAIESLLCARVADGMIDDRHDPNQELMAQGVANFVSPFFGGMPATGTIARTTTNVRAGAKTPIAGVVHALTLLAIIMVAAPLASSVPLAALAAILLFVAWNMGEWREFPRLKQFSPQYRTVMMSTFLLTVIIDLTVAVEMGMVLAALFFIYRVSSLTTIEQVTDDSLPEDLSVPPGAVAYRIFGSLFFGAVGKLETLIEPDGGDKPPTVMILDLHKVINVDTTGLDTLDVLRKTLARRGATLVLCDVNSQPLSLMQRAGFLAKLGATNVQPHLPAAIARAEELTAPQSFRQ